MVPSNKNLKPNSKFPPYRENIIQFHYAFKNVANVKNSILLYIMRKVNLWVKRVQKKPTYHSLDFKNQSNFLCFLSTQVNSLVGKKHTNQFTRIYSSHCYSITNAWTKLFIFFFLFFNGKTTKSINLSEISIQYHFIISTYFLLVFTLPTFFFFILSPKDGIYVGKCVLFRNKKHSGSEP